MDPIDVHFFKSLARYEREVQRVEVEGDWTVVLWVVHEGAGRATPAAGVHTVEVAGLAWLAVAAKKGCRAHSAREPLWPPEAGLRLTKRSKNC